MHSSFWFDHGWCSVNKLERTGSHFHQIHLWWSDNHQQKMKTIFHFVTRFVAEVNVRWKLKASLSSMLVSCFSKPFSYIITSYSRCNSSSFLKILMHSFFSTQGFRQLKIIHNSFTFFPYNLASCKQFLKTLAPKLFLTKVVTKQFIASQFCSDVLNDDTSHVKTNSFNVNLRNVLLLNLTCESLLLKKENFRTF